ncbi:hypothetical protein B0H16DRAFT_1525030 [Mycena metata]|uniref:Uncharacterized protein n=1 Tax=Mycena metata TaxID=1033252 RepID=A0AAD7NL30_9AGAR|nr:hypothetical protein B0H16DRAFT_1525030 [Mycena metata]
MIPAEPVDLVSIAILWLVNFFCFFVWVVTFCRTLVTMGPFYILTLIITSLHITLYIIVLNKW